ncbi:hypothetical protein ACNKHR_07095 [Shigella flexneri]
MVASTAAKFVRWSEGSEPQFAGYNRAMQARLFDWFPCKTSESHPTALSQPKILSPEHVDCGCANRAASANGRCWSPQNDDCRYSESGRVMLVDALTRSMNVPTVNLGMALGLPAVTGRPGSNLGVPKD